MSPLDIVQVVVFPFVAIVNIWAIKVSRERRKLERQLKAMEEQR